MEKTILVRFKKSKRNGKGAQPGGIAIVTTEYIINNKNPPDLTNQFYNERTIYSHLIDKTRCNEACRTIRFNNISKNIR